MILVVGGAGFVGSHLVDALRDRGKRIRVLDGLMTRPGDRAQRLRERVFKWASRVELVKGDCTNAAVVRAAMDGVSQVIHCGHLVGSRASVSEPVRYLQNNILGTEVITAEMERAAARSLVLCSSGLVYGRSGSERSRETDVPTPASPFAASMVGAEAVATAWQAMTGGSLTIVRPFTTYGPRMRPDSGVYRFLEGALTGREVNLFGRDRSRDFVYIGDVIRVLLEARRVESTRHPAIFNVASGQSTSMHTLLREIEAVTGKRVHTGVLGAQSGDVPSTWGSPTWTTQQLKITAKTGLEEGLKRTAEWLQHRLTGQGPQRSKLS